MTQKNTKTDSLLTRKQVYCQVALGLGLVSDRLLNKEARVSAQITQRG